MQMRWYMVTPELIVEQRPDFQHMSSKIYQADTLCSPNVQKLSNAETSLSAGLTLSFETRANQLYAIARIQRHCSASNVF